MNRNKKNRKPKSKPPVEAQAEPDKKKKVERSEIDDRDPAVIRAEKFRTQGSRETVEALVVAFVLALLFRAFIAEAFVIPTGSMAPTLMGAHKDLFCDRCGTNFPVGASWERSSGSRNTIVAGICPNCRHVNSLDLADNSGHKTFNGDRILVSKFAYTMSDPERWDVIVFKFPGNPKQNYIKRLVGLPNETLTVRHGDIYARPLGSDATKDQILRRPPEKLLAMKHRVYDSDFQAMDLVSAKYPSRWQPWAKGVDAPPTDSWQLERTDDGLTATLEGTDKPKWLRYFHRWADDEQWRAASDGNLLNDVDPYAGRLITDFYAYNSFVHVDSRLVYDMLPNEDVARSSGLTRNLLHVKSLIFGPNFELSKNYTPGGPPEQFGRDAHFGGSSGASGRDGTHWVGDLIFESEVETTSDSKELMLQIVEAGVKHHCRIDLSNGEATLSISSGDQQASFDGESDSNLTRVASTGWRAGSRRTVRFSNCDDQLLLWIDDELVTFDQPTTFDSRSIVPLGETYPKYEKGVDPLDAAPVGIAVTGGKATIHHLKIDRDKYYIATKDPSSIADYEGEFRHRVNEIQALFGIPSEWEANADVWRSRRSVSFDMADDQFFPMGDNSPASLDARCWAGSKVRGDLPSRFKTDAYKWSHAEYVPRDLLVGKALMVFWPHPWNDPVPMTPNMKKFRLIR